MDGLLTILENIKVKHVVMGKQFKESQNYKKCVNLAREKDIKVHIVEAGQRINIENDLHIDVLWPDSKNIITENVLNNNSLVCKLIYKNFNILFTGDIEEIAEQSIISKYSDKLDILKATVLKVAHHGSKTSSITELLNAVKPKIALIGVGKDNKFGHPSDITLRNLEIIGCKIYRTDQHGEIIINTDGKRNKVTTFIR